MSIQTIVILCFMIFVLLDLAPAGPVTRKVVSWIIVVVLFLCLLASFGAFGGIHLGNR